MAPMKVTNSTRPVLAIFGPTASGKSAVAEAVADRIPAEIVSADSMQVYRGLPILTNQPERPTRLAAVWELEHQASVGEYARLAHAAIDDALAGGRTPVVVGGTGLYLRSALADLQLPPPAAPGRRAHFERFYDRVGSEHAHAALAELDPGAAEKIHPNDRRRVVRALELAELGESLAPDSSRLWTEEMRRPTMIFGLDVSRDVLSQRIKVRAEAMFDRGVEEEVTRALARAPSGTARQVIGLREIARLPRAAAIAAVTLRTLQYAAYQRKWMRRIPGLIPLDAESSPDEVARELLAVAGERFTLLGQQEESRAGIRKGEADHTGHAVGLLRPARRTGRSENQGARAGAGPLPFVRVLRVSAIPFEKWHGLGNDYLLVERAALAAPLDPPLVRRLCDYHVGVGSDGILEILLTDGPRTEIVIWNPDGSTAELSGNGTRIAARWLARKTGEDEVTVSVGDRQVTARMRTATEVETEMGPVEVSPVEGLDVDGTHLEFTPVSLGNPHAVIAREPDRADLLRLGPLVENHARFPERTNVQLMRVDSRGEATAGVWERGAGETLSSGTSACAVAAAAIANGWCDSPVTVHLAGGDLLVELDEHMHARLTGPAQQICSGETAEEWLPK